MRDLAVAVLVALVAIAIGWALFGSSDEAPAPPAAPPTLPTPVSEEAQIRAFCAFCHLFPEPATLPRRVWDYEVEAMYALAGATPNPPPLERTLWYYRNRAPDDLPPPVTYVDEPAGPLNFAARGVAGNGLPAVSYLKWDGKRLLTCDMRSGAVAGARLQHPAHVEVVDLDQDGVQDLLVAELGSFEPSDGDKGKVVWLRGPSYQPVTLLAGVGRVADVQAADVDGDGDLDLAVAVFGWRTTGQVLLLENDAMKFTKRQLDHRPGAINVPFVDLNGDGKLDIVVLLAQQFEEVEVFLGDGQGGFEQEVLFQAPHPDYGAAGIEVVDLDGDGDLDVVLVCGDTLDNDFVLKPTQGVYWLENKGSYPFAAKRLASLVGAHKVRAADLDGDGDLDLAAAGFVPQLREKDPPKVPRLDSVLWIEQTARGEFTPHSLEVGQSDHPSLEVGDFDGDGDIDIVVGNFLMEGPETGVDALTYFTNEGRR